MNGPRRSVFARRRAVPRARVRDLDFFWAPWNVPGCEHARVKIEPRGASADSVILLRHPDVGPLRCHYQLTTDSRWRVVELRIALFVSEAAKQESSLVMTADGHGAWRVNGRREPRLDGCLDLDIEATPLTNSLPIRRLALAAGESADLKSAFVPVPELTPRPAPQRYSCLAPLGDDGGRFGYENPLSGFAAELTVDSEGFVVDYPGSFRRLD